ncbi:MAG: nucleotidyltransferase family protein [Alphaproteobacteria bacterium]
MKLLKPQSKPKPKAEFQKPKTAMILAAGYGRRMLPLTETQPKILLNVLGTPLLDHLLGYLERENINKTVINTFHLGKEVEAYCDQNPRNMTLLFSREEVLLDTGGGVKRVLPEFKNKPFLLINGDIFWKNYPPSCLETLIEAWDETTMDALLLLIPREKAFGYEGPGSFFKNSQGRLSWRGDKPEAPFVFGGVQLLHPRAYDGITDVVFSNRLMWDQLLHRKRLYGVTWEGSWYHLGTLEAYQQFLQEAGKA